MSSAHFLLGSPALLDGTNPHWVISASMGYATKKVDYDHYYCCKTREHCNDNIESITVHGRVPVDSSPVDNSILVDGDVSGDDSVTLSSNSKPEQGSTVHLDSKEGSMDFDQKDTVVHFGLENQKLQEENVKLRGQLTTKVTP